MHNMKKVFFYGLYLIVVIFICCELVLRFTPLGNNYTLSKDLLGNVYDPFKVGHTDPCGTVGLTSIELANIFKKGGIVINPDSLRFNSLNLLNREIDTTAEIIGVGDSFMEGMGADPDSAFINVVARNTGKPVINTGQSGSDPLFEEKMVERIFEKNLKPTHILLTINYSDISDVIIRGGQERFIGNDSVVYRKPPHYYPVYRSSYVVRALFTMLRFDNSLVSPFARPKKVADALSEIQKAINRIDLMCKENQCRLLVIVHPLEYEIQSGRWELDPLIRNLRGDKIQTIDMFQEFVLDGRINRKTSSLYYLQGDGHHNGLGYQVFGEITAKKITLSANPQ